MGPAPDRLIDELESMNRGELPDEAYELLADPGARHVLYYMTGEPSATLTELADVVAGLQATDEATVITAGDRDRIRVRLYHSVLPKLDAAGYVRFDPATRTVARGDVPAEVERLFESVRADAEDCDEGGNGNGAGNE